MSKTLAERVFHKLKNEIATGVFAPGDQLPPERNLQLRHNVSRTTINRALSMLHAGGYIIRRQGMGTFVTEGTAANGEVNPATNRRIIQYISPGGKKKGDVYVRFGVVEGIQNVFGAGKDATIRFYYSPEEYVEQLKTFSREDVFGSVVWYTSVPEGDQVLRQMKKAGVNFVLIDAFCPDLECDYVVTDNFDGAGQVVDYLAGRGHRKIVYLTHNYDRTSLKERQAGFVLGMVNHGLPLDSSSVRVLPSDDTQTVRDTVRSIMTASERPTALFACNDNLAFEVHAAVKDLGLKVPDEVSLVGYDDVDRSEHFEVPLTTIHQDFYQMARLAGFILEEQSKQKIRPYSQQLRLKPSLVVRNSVRSL